MKSSLLIALVVCLELGVPEISLGRARWTADEAKSWQQEHPQIWGINYYPSTTHSKVDMWSAAHFNEAEIAKNLSELHDLKCNSIQVFFHFQAWEIDPDGALRRLETFLTTAAKFELGVTVNLLDFAWNPRPEAVPPALREDTLSGTSWALPEVARLIAPEGDAIIRTYIQSVISAHCRDDRIAAWNLWNEPTSLHGRYLTSNRTAIMRCLPIAFAAARESNPVQPVISSFRIVHEFGDFGVLNALSELVVKESDLFAFNGHPGTNTHLDEILKSVGKVGRPLICTGLLETRPKGTLHQSFLPVWYLWMPDLLDPTVGPQ